MSVSGGVRKLRSPSVVALAMLAVVASVPADAAARSGLAIAGAPAKSLRLCGAVHRTASASSGTHLVATIRSRPRGAAKLTISRCEAGRWSAFKSVRIPHKHRVKVRLPRLPAGGYRISARGLTTFHLRVLRSAPGQLAPLLDRATVRAPMVAFCDGPDGAGPHRSDATPLPPDPRTLVNGDLDRSGQAVYFNASWIPVHDAPGMRPTPFQPPKTCGQFRRDASDGRDFVQHKQFFQLIASPKAYDNLWRVWGLKSKPADFDLEVRERYGLSEAPFRNPYPLPGQNPNATGGGSGQLPLGLIMGQDKKTGAYMNEMTITCAACHDSMIGDTNNGVPFAGGRGSDAFDATLFGGDLAQAAVTIGESPDPGTIATAAVPFPYSGGRALTDSFGLLDFLGATFDMETLDASPGVEFFPTHGGAGQVQTPNWWNRSHRTRMFLGGELSGDNTRVSMALATAQTQRSGAEVRALEPKFEQTHVYLDSLSPPKYPGKVDTKLAEEGAIIFHDKNLWADSRNKSIPQPPGNGSCASCHGVYSPRYADDKTFLPTPRLKGIEANITPIQTIGTDPARTRLVNEQFKRAWDTSWWGYDDLNPKWTKDGQGRAGTTFERLANDYAAQNSRLEGPNVWSNSPIGYEAPPLYGAWASAPYFHNGSIPTIRDVLQPGRRPALWERPLTPPAQSGIVQGVDQSMNGYDFQNLGLKYNTVPCDTHGLKTPYVPCEPKGSPLSTVEGTISNLFGPDLFLANQVPPPMSDDDRQRRMIYNSNEYSMGNQGHDFTQALDDHEVAAVLEYIKTL
jgi:mono/diheme cytochrome c family protein